MDAPAFPSGEQYEIRHRGQRAVVVEVGGALRSYEVDGIAVLDGYGVLERCSGARGHTLVPWPNRLEDGRYSFAGAEHQLPLTEPGKHNSIHGLVRWTNFGVLDHTPNAITMTQTIHPQPGYPFAIHVGIEYRLCDDGLRVSTVATNVGGQMAPYGCGAHPYLRLPVDKIDGLRFTAPGRLRLEADGRGIPTGAVTVVGTDYDFRSPREIGGIRLDTGFTDLERDDHGLAWVHLEDASGSRVSLWCDAAYPYLMLFTGDTLKDEEHRRAGLGVEPMSCAPNAFQTGEGLTVLAPGECHRAEWGIAGDLKGRRP